MNWYIAEGERLLSNPEKHGLDSEEKRLNVLLAMNQVRAKKEELEAPSS